MTKQEKIQAICANDFALMKGSDKPSFVLIDTDPVSRPLREWLQNNPLYPTVFVFENGIEHYTTTGRYEPEFEPLFNVTVAQANKSGIGFRVSPNDGKQHSATILHPEGMSQKEAAMRSKTILDH